MIVCYTFFMKNYTDNQNISLKHLGWRHQPLWQQKLFAVLLLCALCLLLSSCQKQGLNLDLATSPSNPPTNGAALASSQTENPPAIDDAQTIATSASPVFSASAPSATLSPQWMQSPFDRQAFAIDPYAAFSPARGDIYAPLPNGTVIGVTVGWIDAEGQPQQSRQILSMKSNKVTYSFLLPQDLSPQYFYLSAEMNFAVAELSQPENIRALFGENGENLPFPPAVMGPNGSHAFFSSWSIAYPDSAAADAIIFSSLAQSIGVAYQGAAWEDGCFVVTLQDHSPDSNSLRMALTASQQAALSFMPDDADANPLVIIVDTNHQEIARTGSDLHQEESVPAAVYVSDGGERYHEATCRYAHGAHKLSLDIALLLGYTPCRICH